MSYKDIARRAAAEAVRHTIRKANRRMAGKTAVRALDAFAVIAASGEQGIGATDCAEMIGASAPGMHKTAARLSNSEEGGGGLGLIEVAPDPKDPRRVRYRASRLGQEFWEELLRPILGEFEEPSMPAHQVVRINATEEADREVLRNYGIDPDHAFVFGPQALDGVKTWIAEQEGLKPSDCLRVSPFGGYAITFTDSNLDLAFFIRWSAP